MTSPPLPGRHRPYIAAPFLGIAATLVVQAVAGALGLLSAQTAVLALILAGALGATFGVRYADETISAVSLMASLAAGGAVMVLIVAGSL